MPHPPAAREGIPLKVRQAEVVFSYWPMRKGSRRWGLHSMLYAADPWSVMESACQDRCRSGDRETALSFVRQAKEYYAAAESAVNIETKPVLFYYSFLNAVKALGLAERQSGLIGSVFHGVSHQFRAGETITTAKLRIDPSSAGRRSVFDSLMETLAGSPIARSFLVDIAQLMPQSVVGHRLWCEAADRKERFVGISKIRLMEEPSTQSIWSVVEVPAEDFSRMYRSVSSVIDQSGLAGLWRQVANGMDARGQECRRFEQVTPISYHHRSADYVVDLVDPLKPILHRTILGGSPYRRYYLYLCPISEVAARLPQLAVTHLIMFFLGSLTRYRPRYLLDGLDGPYGGFLREFLVTQPAQYVYGLASEFAQREISRAEVV